MMNTPSNMEVLIHCHVSADPHPRAHAPAVKEGLEKLLLSGLIAKRYIGPSSAKGVTNPYELTEMGEFYLKYVLAVPFPTMKTIYAIEAPKLD